MNHLREAPVKATVGYGSVGEARILPEAKGTVALPSVDPAPLSETLAAPPRDPLAGRTILPRISVTPGGGAPRLEPCDRPRYREVSTLGAGGIGEVRLANDEDIGRSVAIKRLLDPGDEGLTLRFVDEVKVLGQLDHPNIVPVHDVGRDASGRFYFVMKKIDGETLESVIDKLRAGDPETAARYPIDVRMDVFLDVLRAVQFAHARRIVHRDIKPANIMVGRYGEVVLMDWGIAKRLGDPVSEAIDAAVPARDEIAPVSVRPFQTRVGALLGTPIYMSPEQARGESATLDERSDVYSLAVVLHEFLTLGHYLAGIEDLSAILTAVVAMDAAPPADVHAPGTPVPKELSNLVMRGMQKRVEDRYGSVSEMIEALHRVRSGTFEISCPATLTKRGLIALGRAIDAHSKGAAIVILLGALSTVATLAYWLVRAVT